MTLSLNQEIDARVTSGAVLAALSGDSDPAARLAAMRLTSEARVSALADLNNYQVNLALVGNPHLAVYPSIRELVVEQLRAFARENPEYDAQVELSIAQHERGPAPSPNKVYLGFTPSGRDRGVDVPTQDAGFS